MISRLLFINQKGIAIRFRIFVLTVWFKNRFYICGLSDERNKDLNRNIAKLI